MVPRRRPARRPRRVPRRKTGKKMVKVSRPLRRAVKAIVKSQAETKRVSWYNTYNDGTLTTKATGNYAGAGWAVQNNRITINNTDILRLIPTCVQGLDDWNRIGTKIRPTNLSVKGQVRIRFSFLNEATNVLPQNLTIDLYVLQHVRLKDYDSLYGLNDFTQMLENNEGTTQAYLGRPPDSGLRVADEHYKVLQRRRITLRYAGVLNGGAATQVPYIQSQDHTWYSEFNLNLTKHIPKVLTYPEQNSGAAPTPPVVLGAPTNSSVFMAIGYCSWYSNPTFVDDVNTAIEQTYVSEMSFKDS